MIDLTPLDVRNKRGDFKKIMRGYDPQEVDIFLEIVAERLEALVRENIQLRERTQTLQGQVNAQAGREQAVQDALVTAQELRADMQNQAQREADHIVKEAEVEARQLLAEADAEVRNRLRGVERRLDQGQHALDDLERRRTRFLKEFRGLLEREMDVVTVEEGRGPLEDRAIDLDLGSSREPATRPAETAIEEDAPAPADDEPEPADEASSAQPAEAPASGDTGAAGPAADAAVAAAGIAAAGATVFATTDTPPSTTGSVEAEQSAPPVSAGSMPAASSPAPEPGRTPEASTGQREPVPERIPEVDVSAVLADMAPPPAPEAVVETPVVLPQVPTVEPTVDVADLRPTEPAPAPPPAPPAPELAPEPTTLELELMAGAEHASQRVAHQEKERFHGVPDLETVLAEAGVEEVRPPSDEEIAPPPAHGVTRDSPLMFDDDDAKR